MRRMKCFVYVLAFPIAYSCVDMYNAQSKSIHTALYIGLLTKDQPCLGGATSIWLSLSVRQLEQTQEEIA